MPGAPLHFAISKAMRFANYKAVLVCWVESAMISQRKGWHCACGSSLTHDSNFRSGSDGGRHIYRHHSCLLSNLLVLRQRVRPSITEGVMTSEYVIGIVVSFLIMDYLIYALLWPEKF